MAKVIAVTGGIGSGKSTVSKILTNLGYCVFDADIFAREVLFRPAVEARVKSVFGSHVFLEKGILNRELVRKMVYDNPALRKKLEDILHPAIAEELKIKSQMLSKLANNAWIFYEASLILEIGKKDHFDACVVVTTHHQAKLNRLSQSRNLSEEELNKIIASQMPDSEKIKHADYLIENSGSFTDLESHVYNLIRFLYNKFSPSSF